MDETKYLKQLQEQGLLSELLMCLGLPSKAFDKDSYGCEIKFNDEKLLDSGKPYCTLSIKQWEDDIIGSKYAAWRNITYILNDYIFLLGIPDQDQMRLQRLYNYMKAHFDTYTDDCVKFLKEHQEKRFVEIDEKSAKEKTAIDERFSKQKEIVKAKTADKINLLLGNK